MLSLNNLFMMLLLKQLKQECDYASLCLQARNCYAKSFRKWQSEAVSVTSTKLKNGVWLADMK